MKGHNISTESRIKVYKVFFSLNFLTRRVVKKSCDSKLLGFEVKSIYYSDSIGFFASLMMKLVGYDRDNGIGSPASLKIYDRYILPFSKFFDAIGLKLLFGKNIIAVAKKID